jgi:hypothetical protein
LVPFAPAASRTLEVFGAPVTLVLVPGRKERLGRTTPDRPPFRRSAARRPRASSRARRSGAAAGSC